MIELTRLNGHPLVVNCDLIKYVESSPDTMLTLVTGDKIMVRESCGEVIARANAHRARLLFGAGHQPNELAKQASVISANRAHTIASLAHNAPEGDGE